MAFVFLNFNLRIGVWDVGLFPSFVGYFFILKGLTEMSGLSHRIYKMTPAVLIVGAFSAMMYVIELFGAVGAGAFGHILVLISINVALYVAYSFVMGIQDIEVHKKQDLNLTQLFFAWKVLAVGAFLPIVARFAPIPELLTTAISFAVVLYFLVVLDKTRRLVYANNPLA